ncbi:hypothetical protein HYH03_007436 [Edaphochlamys debaryana]|uniref:Uncharacterized protein n=1 Tax=Edaphochlamys debaryana TaxID=47281 RepID=A0A836BZ71_9CHLO|nr:hypothetical protein HYH03_007436 [Edaphochlamys debaryana]|eukprot:KAG2494380.1 hypothetical protein HYH03_007436 [Edaphochlamys debaryana]
MPVPTQSSGVTSWLAQLDMFFSKQQRPTAGALDNLSDVNWSDEDHDDHAGHWYHSHLADRLAMQPIDSDSSAQ